MTYWISQILITGLLPCIILILAGRQDTRHRIGHFLGRFQTEKGRLGSLNHCDWIHAVSYGEMRSALAFLEFGRKQKVLAPKVLITTTIDTAASLACQHTDDDSICVMYLPLDWHPVMKGLIRKIRPRRFFLVETDFWPSLLLQLKKYGTQTYLINGRISPKIRQMWQILPSLFLPMLKSFTELQVATVQDQKTLHDLLDQKTPVLGQFKYDALKIHSAIQTPGFPTGTSDEPILLFASWHPNEWGVIQSLIQKNLPIQIWIAPRNPKNSSAFSRALKTVSRKVTFLSEAPQTLNPRTVLILDQMGILTSAYHHSSLALVGGSFNQVGGHNFLEPIAQKRPVITGPNLRNMEKDAEDFSSRGLLKIARDEHHCLELIQDFLTNPRPWIETSIQAETYLKTHQGAIQRSWESILRFS